MRNSTIIRLLCLVIAGASYATNVFSQLTDWKNYTSKNWVYCVMDDGDYLWIGTDGGLVKMNKATGEKSYYDRANAGLADNRIYSLAKDKEGNIWVGTRYNGVGCFDGTKCNAIYNEITPETGYEEYCTSIAIDADNNKWVGSLFYLNKFDGKSWQNWTTPNSSIISSIWVIHSMKFDKDGVLWMGGTGGWSFARFTGTEIEVLWEENEVHGLEIDKDDNKWLATDGGLFKYDGKNFIEYEKSLFSLPSNSFTDMTKDKEDNLWLIGKGGYLIKYDGDNFTNYKVPFSIEEDWLTCIGTDDENVWLGTRYGGLIKFKNGEFTHIKLSASPPLTNGVSFCADIDNKNNMWIGTDHNLIRIDANDFWTSHYENFNVRGERRISGLKCFDNGDMWVALGRSDTCLLKINQNEVIAFTKQNTPLLNHDPELREYFTNFLLDKKRNIWVASDGGLYKYDGKRWYYYTPENSPLPHYQITSLALDKDDNLWVGAASFSGGGLCKYDGTNWTIYTTSNSELPTPFVATMAFDSKNVLWLSCRDTTYNGIVGEIFGSGLTRFDGKSWRSYNIDNSDIPSNTIMDIVIDKNDHLWLATYGRRVGITKYDRTNWEVYNVDNSGIAYNKVSKITLDYKRDLIWLNHLDYGGISTAKLNFKANSIDTPPINNDKSSFIYSNPAKDHIAFRLKEDEIPEKAEVYDMSGRLICSKPIHSSSVALSELNIHQKGIYLLKIYVSPDKQYSERLVVTE